MISIALTEENLAQAVEYIHDLLQPHRKRLPEALSASMQKVLDAYENGGDVRTALTAAVALAESLRGF